MELGKVKEDKIKITGKDEAREGKGRKARKAREGPESRLVTATYQQLQQKKNVGKGRGWAALFREMWGHLAQLGLQKDEYHPHFQAKPSQAMQKLEAAK
eukprot:1157591-Pelagomonas_calceolata.AAC.7